MKGINELHLNTATLIEALQWWLDHKMLNGAPTVTAVKAINKISPTFVVTVMKEKHRQGKIHRRPNNV